MSDCRGADQIVPLRGEEREPLDLLRVLLHRQRVDRADGLESLRDTRRFGLQRLQVEIEQSSAFQELIEGPMPLGLDSLDDASSGA